jgi:plasmid stabilization system protein ParE
VKLRWVRQALREVEDALSWYEREGEGLPERFRDELKAALAFIIERPERLPLRDGGYRRVNFRKYPYHLPYIVRDQILWIMAVAHNKRRPGYWLPRRSQIE